MVSASGSLKNFCVQQPLDHEQRGDRAADRHRQIGDADRDDRKLGDAWYQVVCTSLMPYQSMNRLVASMHELDQPAEQRLARAPSSSSGQDADADVQVFAVADDGRQERQHDHQQHGHRLGP